MGGVFAGISSECPHPVKLANQTRIEWALLGVVAVVCAGLSVLQYRWTGEISRAERVRLRSGLDEQVQRLVRAFEDEIRDSCTALLPAAEELATAGRAEAHRGRYRNWASSHDPSLFSRVGVVVPERGGLALYGFDAEGGLSPIEWPANWEPLRNSMSARLAGSGPPPSAPVDSTLIEMPVFSGNGGRHGPSPELEWMIFEIDEQHLRSKTLPLLVSAYLNPDGGDGYDVSVSWTSSRGGVIFSTRPDGASVIPGADLTTGIFSAEAGAMPGRRHGHGRNEQSRTQWTLAARHRAGSLDAAVARVRTRNLATSLVLIGLLGGAAWVLVRYTARSRRLSEMQFRFAAGVSHDLRTPLTVIRGAAFNLADGVVKEPSAVGRYAKVILRNAEELSSMIENVLAFSATLHPRTDDRSEAFAIGDLVDHAAAAMAQEIEQAGCRIDLTVAPGLPAVAGDPVAIELAIRNLIGNAVRHAAEGKWIGVSAEPCSTGVEVRVCDRGPGIDEAERERIFEPFYRGDRTRTGRVRGTGLGLSLVRDTVGKHHGTVTVDSCPGGGAQFTMRLPAFPEAV
jgi:signal transduction histidine kinase